MKPTFENISKRISEILAVPIEDVKPSASFVDDLGADSIDLLEMIMSMEEEFDIEISDADAEKLITVDDAANFINKTLTAFKNNRHCQ